VADNKGLIEEIFLCFIKLFKIKVKIFLYFIPSFDKLIASFNLVDFYVSLFSYRFNFLFIFLRLKIKMINNID